MTAPSQAVEQKHAACIWDDCDQQAVYCSGHAREFVAPEIDALTARVRELEAALKPLAGIPLEDFGWERSPDRPVTGWNKHTLYVRDVLAARAALAGGAK